MRGVGCVLDAIGNERRSGVSDRVALFSFHLPYYSILPKRETGKWGLVRVSEVLALLEGSSS